MKSIVALTFFLINFEPVYAQNSCSTTFQANHQEAPETYEMDDPFAATLSRKNILISQAQQDGKAPAFANDPKLLKTASVSLALLEYEQSQNGRLSADSLAKVTSLAKLANGMEVNGAENSLSLPFKEMLWALLNNLKRSEQELSIPEKEFLANFADQKTRASIEQTAPVSFWDKIKGRLFGKRYTLEQIHHKNPNFSPAQIKYRLEMNPRFFDSFSQVPSIRLVTPKETERLAKISKQKISPLLAEEQELLALSSVDLNPREVLRVIVVTQNGKQISKPYFGEKDRIDVSALQIVSLLSEVDLTIGNIDKVIVTHTHPVYQIVVGEKITQYTALSPLDLTLAEEIKSHLGNIPLEIRAATPNGFSYSRTY